MNAVVEGQDFRIRVPQEHAVEDRQADVFGFCLGVVFRLGFAFRLCLFFCLFRFLFGHPLCEQVLRIRR